MKMPKMPKMPKNPKMPMHRMPDGSMMKGPPMKPKPKKKGK